MIRKVIATFFRDVADAFDQPLPIPAPAVATPSTTPTPELPPARPEVTDADFIVGVWQLRAALNRYSPPAPPGQA